MRGKSVFVSNILESKNGDFWIGTVHQGLLLYNGSSLIKAEDKLLNSETGIGAISETKNGTLWFTADGNIYTYNRNTLTRIKIETEHPKLKPFQIYEDNQEHLWFVGFGGAYRYDNKEFVNITREGPW
jgi:ligand-binding sensor domain-containing protein